MAAGEGWLLHGKKLFLLYSSKLTAGDPLGFLKLRFSSPCLGSSLSPFGTCHSDQEWNSARAANSRAYQVQVRMHMPQNQQERPRRQRGCATGLPS